MIENIELLNFKAYVNLNIEIKNKNLLIYGDNGTGKSSIYESLKVAFFKNKLIDNISFKTEEKEEKINEVFSREYDNKSNANFEIKINNRTVKADTIIENFNINANLINLYSVELTSEEQGDSKKDIYKTLNLKDLLKREFLSINLNLLDSKKDQIVASVNSLLLEFKEEIKINIDNEFNVTIFDENRKIQNEKYLNLYFNEAKLNLIVLLLLFVSIENLSNTTSDKLIVLDDFITSLDISNRTFLIQYVIKSFNKDDFQLIFLTHSLEFFNLVKYMIEEKITSTNINWLYKQLYDLNNNICISDVKPIDIEIIEKEIRENPSNAGNLIRKKFENIIHTMAKDLTIGSIDTSNNILTTILNHDVLYLKSKGNGKKQQFYTSNDLLVKIEQIIFEGTTVIKIQELIDEYKIPSNKLDVLKQTLNGLKLYRKVIMHPLSHTEAQFSMRELYKSLDLLKNLEENLISILNTDNPL